MAEENKDDKKIEVSMKLLTDMQKQMAEQDKKIADMEAKNAGLEELFAKTASTEGQEKLREKKSFEPKFRTVRLRQYPIAGDENNLGWVVGWTNKGAYQEVDKGGVTPQYVDYLDIIFLGQEKTKDGKIKAEKVKLLDLMNKGAQTHCKILETRREEVKTRTGVDIIVSVFDPAHGLVQTGDVIDGYVTHSEIEYKVSVPGVGEVWVDALYCN